MKRKAIILGIKGISLTNGEKRLIKNHKPWGIILFSRNIKNLEQTKKLIINIKSLMKDKKYPILIDEEGGSVSRLEKIIDMTLFSQDYFGKIYYKNKNKFYDYYKIYIETVSAILNELGININTVPVLDIKRKKTNRIIYYRSFSKNANIVARLGKFCIAHYQKNKIATVVKHIPGHGLSSSDSHLKLSKISNNKNYLIRNDFIPFKKCKSFFAMTAHIIYSAYDSKFTATHSKKLIDEVIRKNIGFKGILISDDISMKALKYSLTKNATMALEAGCNLVLHCNGNIKQMNRLIKIVPSIDIFTQKKTSQFYKFLG
tara:strand:+ start:1016 stop:1963 length:948 start_codon:yes stop_codon:yes gene_type:complete